MNKYKVTATMAVGYTSTITAENEEEALAIARGVEPYEPYFEKTDEGHCWTVTGIEDAPSKFFMPTKRRTMIR